MICHLLVLNVELTLTASPGVTCIIVLVAQATTLPAFVARSAGIVVPTMPWCCSLTFVEDVLCELLVHAEHGKGAGKHSAQFLI